MSDVGIGCTFLSVSPAELMERATVPPLWPALYPPGRGPLHHAQQLQLFSQQHFLRQQELLYLQQQAAQALELQRSAQLVVSCSGGGHMGPFRSPCVWGSRQINQQGLQTFRDCDGRKTGGPLGRGDICPDTWGLQLWMSPLGRGNSVRETQKGLEASRADVGSSEWLRQEGSHGQGHLPWMPQGSQRVSVVS